MDESHLFRKAKIKFLITEIATYHLEVILCLVMGRLETGLPENSLFLDLEMGTLSGCSESNVSKLKEGTNPKSCKRDMIQKGRKGTQKAP